MIKWQWAQLAAGVGTAGTFSGVFAFNHNAGAIASVNASLKFPQLNQCFSSWVLLHPGEPSGLHWGVMSMGPGLPWISIIGGL